MSPNRVIAIGILALLVLFSLFASSQGCLTRATYWLRDLVVGRWRRWRGGGRHRKSDLEGETRPIHYHGPVPPSVGSRPDVVEFGHNGGHWRKRDAS
jgi:hypothetical protein